MLKTITEVSAQLVAFVLALRLSLSRPQQQHVMQVAALAAPPAAIGQARCECVLYSGKHLV
jgi:hypothetical protein